jgi:hypothetical protein
MAQTHNQQSLHPSWIQGYSKQSIINFRQQKKQQTITLQEEVVSPISQLKSYYSQTFLPNNAQATENQHPT